MNSKEGFQNGSPELNANSLTNKTNTVLNKNDYSSQKETVNNLKQELISIQHDPIIIPTYDGTYIMINRSIKFLLNFLLTFLFIKFIIGNWPDLSINQFILVICTVSSVLLYILDLIYPSCSL